MKWFEWVVGIFVAVLLISNTVSAKILVLGPFTFDGGTILFPLAYIFGDVLTEVYGYQRSRRVIWIGFASLILMALVYAIVGALPPAAGWHHQSSYQNILGMVPRIVIASIIAYWAGSFSNAYSMAKIKIFTKGRFLWIRTIGSTLLGQGVDTVLFILIAFVGVLPTPLLISIFISNYIFKVGIEALMTPVTYKVVNFLKRAENIDVFDTHTRFNPFSLSYNSEKPR